MKLAFASALFTILISGCAAKPKTLGAGGGTIPPRPASATYPGWEYYCASVDSGLGYGETVARLLNDAGKQGWELAVIHEIPELTFCFKRPLLDPAAVATALVAPAPAPAPTVAPIGTDAPVGDPLSGPPDELVAALEKSVLKLEENHYQIPKDLFDRLLKDQNLTQRGARVVPWMKDGKMNGFKLYAIRPTSVYALLGFSNGDTVHEINGFALSSAEEALKIFDKVREASNFELTMTRRGKPMSLRYSIR